MEEQKSQFLHFLRWISALFVAIGHSQMIGGGGNSIFIFLASHAHAAVMVFFVLSGYVIAATVEKKRASGYKLQQYFIDRISRIYSVLIPAIILTMLLDFIGTQLFPVRYSDPNLLPQTHGIIRFLVNAFSLQGLWGYRVQFGSNPALWSIGYEFCYYVLFGLVTWKPKYWQLLVAATLLVYGPTVSFYGIIWALGVFAYRSDKRLPLLPVLALFLVANHFLEYQPAIELPEFVRDFLFAITVMLLIMARPKINRRLFPINREMAEFSYSLYAYHTPILFMAYSFITPTPISAWGMVVLCLILSRLLYYITENKRATLKSALTRIGSSFAR
ncbi:MAG: acyltransferase [Desulfomonile tiedjei]|nr:acyltransferase [Desulfomonile tiedjei]